MSEGQILGAMIGGVLFLFVGLAFIFNGMNEYGCAQTAAAMGVDYKYSFTTECLIKPVGKPWVPLHSYRVL